MTGCDFFLVFFFFFLLLLGLFWVCGGHHTHHQQASKQCINHHSDPDYGDVFFAEFLVFSPCIYLDLMAFFSLQCFSRCVLV